MKDERTFKIIGACMEVHKHLGCGFLEAVYQDALEQEFILQGIIRNIWKRRISGFKLFEGIRNEGGIVNQLRQTQPGIQAIC